MSQSEPGKQSKFSSDQDRRAAAKRNMERLRSALQRGGHKEYQAEWAKIRAEEAAHLGVADQQAHQRQAQQGMPQPPQAQPVQPQQEPASEQPSKPKQPWRYPDTEK